MIKLKSPGFICFAWEGGFSGQGGPGEPDPLGSRQDDLVTEIPGQSGGGYGYDDAETELGQDFHPEDEDETILGQVYRQDETELEFVEEGPIAILWVKEGPRRGQIHRVKENSVVGRTRGDILLDDPKVSSSHAKFTFEDEKFHIWDFGTRNGTFVNGERIRAATPLEENDEIKIGAYLFVFKILS